MSDTNAYWSTHRRRSVSECETNLLNSTVNLRGNPYLYIPPDRAESNPNLSISGFIDESPFAGPGTHLQSQKENNLKVLRSVKMVKNQFVSLDEFQQQFELSWGDR